MNILITGGSGFVGQHVIARLLESDASCHITNIDLNPSKIQDSRLKTTITDIRDRSQCVKLENIKYDYCIHLAALCKEPGFKWEEYFETNDLGTKNVLEYLSRCEVNTMAFTSTMMVYKAGEHQKKESDITCPDTAYGISKLLAEREIEKWSAAKMERNYFVIRPSVIFGENENANFTRLYNSLKKGLFAYVGRKDTVKSCVYVKEVCNVVLFSIQKGIYGTYNFAFAEDSRIGTIVSSFKQVFGFKPFVPVIPMWLLKNVARGFLVLNNLGFKNSIHPRRMEKLNKSSNIGVEKIKSTGFQYQYNLISALEDWKKYL